MDQIWREFPLRARRILVCGQKSFRDKTTEVRADCALFHKPNIPLAVVEAKDNSQAMGAGMLEQTILKTWSVDTLKVMHPLIESHRAELLNLARQRGLVGTRAFGSMSRDDANDERDADLLVTLAPGTSALALGGLLLDARDLLGRRVDAATEASLHPTLRERVVSAALPL